MKHLQSRASLNTIFSLHLYFKNIKWYGQLWYVKRLVLVHWHWPLQMKTLHKNLNSLCTIKITLLIFNYMDESKYYYVDYQCLYTCTCMNILFNLLYTLMGQKYFRTKIFPYVFHIKPLIFITFSWSRFSWNFHL